MIDILIPQVQCLLCFHVKVIKCSWNAHRGQCHRGPKPCLSMYLSIPIRTYSSSNESHKSAGHTFRNNLLLSPPLSQDGKQESQRIRDRHGKTQFCFPISTFPLTTSPHIKKSKLTSLPNQQEEPHTSRHINQERHRISRILQCVVNPIQYTPHFGLEP
jgi:hypothetical protein